MNEVLDKLSRIGLEIADQVPIKGSSATNQECVDRRKLVESHLDKLGAVSGEWCGYTGTLASGKAVWRQSKSFEEAAISQAMWWGEPLVSMWIDPMGEDYARLRVEERRAASLAEAPEGALF